MVPNVYALIGHSPRSLQSVLAWSEALAGGGLSKREIEQINLHVSELNGCAYCVSAHGALGGRVGLKPDEITAARDGSGSNERENALGLCAARGAHRRVTGGRGSGSAVRGGPERRRDH